MTDPIIPLEIAQGPDAIRATLASAGPVAADVGARLRRDGTRRVYVIGNGTSYHSSLAAAGLYRRTAGPDDPIVIPLTAGAFLTYDPPLGPGDVIVGISASGEFRDVVAVAERYQGRRPVVGVIHVPDSTLTRLVSDVVMSAGGPSDVPVMTKTFSATLVATELVLLGLLEPARADPVIEQIRQAADHAETAIAAVEADVDRLAAELADTEHILVVGSGAAHVAALEAALKLKEMAIIHAEGTETWEMASGAATIVGPDTIVIALAPDGPGRAATADVVRHAAEWGARVIVVGPDALVDGATLIRLPADAAEDHAPLTAVPPIARVAYELARRRGHDADHPDWVSRYRSQGLRHVVGA